MPGQINNKARQGTGKLTDDQVKAIRQAKDLYYENMPKNLCKKHNCSRSLISLIWQDRVYTHVV